MKPKTPWIKIKKSIAPQIKKERVTDKLCDMVDYGAEQVFGDFDAEEHPASNDSPKD